MPRLEGHRRGAESVRIVTRTARRQGVKKLTLYAFSEQNWGRPAGEVAGLMELLRDYLLEERDEIMDNGVRLTAIGNLGRLPGFVRDALDALMAESKDNSGMTLCLALSYGGREELTEAMKQLAAQVVEGELAADDITPDQISEKLHVGDVDLVIRTSGENRLSNFLLWQSAYAELFFTETLWPDFGEEQFLNALDVYSARERRFGLVKSA